MPAWDVGEMSEHVSFRRSHCADGGLRQGTRTVCRSIHILGKFLKISSQKVTAEVGSGNILELMLHTICLQCRRPGFSPCVGKIPWRGKWQPTPAFLPGESHGWRSLAGYSPWGCKESGMTVQLTLYDFSYTTRYLSKEV
ncbi:unnamed protein product [Rangifer tarandus platyrhynchus]|uniref:Uncharacterized protein n=1 Tax=Rangifer tarandus platyrhynchus TaxID=3082113 RepID=A0ABN8ZI38_RANTA|nr:unnamed protein product [Rangifer tarandus platyrhynchus]